MVVDKAGWREEKRPFTFTALVDAPYLEFTIKIYPDHQGVTDQLGLLKPGDHLIVEDAWGAIEYKGPGYFIAGGAGVTPFIAIFRQLHREGKVGDNKLFFSNKTERDIILKEEWEAMLGDNAVFVISDEPTERYYPGHIDAAFLKKQASDYSRHFYLCGPPPMMDALQKTLADLGVQPDTLVFEK